MPTPKSVAEYIASTPPAARKALKQIRKAIRDAVPGLTERISYQIPTFDLDGRYLLYMAAFRQHVSVYPVTAGIRAKYGREIAPYQSGRATLRFPLDKPVPVGLIGKLAKVRARELRAARKRPS